MPVDGPTAVATRRPHPAAPVPVETSVTVLAPFSTRLPPSLVERLRLAAPRLGMRQGEITAAALDAFLHQRGL